MTDWFKMAYDWYTDQAKSLSHKTALLVVAILLSIFFDNLIGFSYFYNTARKIEQIEKIETIKKAHSSDSSLVASLSRVERDLFSRRSVFSYAMVSLRDFALNINTGNSNIAKRTTGKKDITTHKKEASSSANISYRSIAFHIISSSYFFVMMALIIPFVLLFDKEKNIGRKIIDFIVALIAFSFIIAVNAFIFWLIESLIYSRTPDLLTYCINIVIHSLFLFVLTKYSNKK